MARYITTTGSAGTTVRTVTANTSAVANERLLIDTTAGAITLTLPGTSDTLVNDTIQFIDIGGNFGTNNATVARNGHKIHGLTEDLSLDIGNSAATLVYSGATYGWVLAGS
jgi:hypothetical protein